MHNRPGNGDLYSLSQRFSGSFFWGSWNIRVHSGNYINFEGQRNHLHRHSYFEACLVLAGCGRFTYRDDDYDLKEGDLFIADPGVIHEIISDEDDFLEIQFVSFSFKEGHVPAGSRAVSLQNLYAESFLRKHRMLCRGSEGLKRCFRQLNIVSSDTDPAAWYLRNEAVLREIVQEVILLSAAEPEGSVEIGYPDSRLKMALEYIKDNSFRKLSVEEIADHACTSSRTLRRLMKEHTGMTVIGKCFEVRMKEAADRLLSSPESPVSDVGYAFGFENPSDFCRGFKKVMGVSPGLFREKKGTVFI